MELVLPEKYVELDQEEMAYRWRCLSYCNTMLGYLHNNSYKSWRINRRSSNSSSYK